VRFVRGDLERLPFADRSVAGLTSFQVIEHFADPGPCLGEMARVLRPDGEALVSTPNRLESDGENPFHLHEYEAAELAGALARHFGEVELYGVHATGPAAEYHASRLRQIRRLTRLDPLGLRRRLPRVFVDWAFERLSVVVRLAARRGGSLERVEDRHHRVGAPDPGCLDLLAVCRAPLVGPSRIA